MSFVKRYRHYRTGRYAAFCVLIVVILMGCERSIPNPDPDDTFGVIPAHFPAMPVPADNPITREKAELGRRLFYEGRLSLDGTVPCASCHRLEASFTDAPFQLSRGVRKQQGIRNAPTLINVGYRKVMFWDGRAATLEDQAMAAFLNPEEMAADTVAVVSLMRSSEYRPAWVSAFGDTVVTMRRVMQAIATFERTLVSANSRYDKFVLGDTTALSAEEKAGMQLFFSDRTKCSECHSGPDLTDDDYHSIGLFHHYFDTGRFEVTKKTEDEGRFKTPTLRNVALTPPYMAGGDYEKGELYTLEQAIERYNDGGVSFANKDPRIIPLNLTGQEQSALVAFLKTLTDSTIFTNRWFAKP